MRKGRKIAPKLIRSSRKKPEMDRLGRNRSRGESFGYRRLEECAAESLRLQIRAREGYHGYLYLCTTIRHGLGGVVRLSAQLLHSILQSMVLVSVRKHPTFPMAGDSGQWAQVKNYRKFMKITGEEKIKNVKARNKNKDGENNPKHSTTIARRFGCGFLLFTFFRFAFFFLDFFTTATDGVEGGLGVGGGVGRKTAAYCSL